MAVMRAAGLVSGETHYAILSRDSDGKVWNGSTWVVYATVDRVEYAIAMTELGDGSGLFTATIPAIDNGAYSYDVHQQVGMIEPAEGDYYVGSGAFALPLDTSTQLDAIQAKTNLIGAGRIANQSPVANNGGLDRLVRGDDYSGTTVQTLTYVDLDDSWPTLTGWTVEYQLRSAEDGPTVLAKAGTVTIATGSGKTITVELTGAETAALTLEGYRRSIVATHTSSGVERTLVRGFAEVQSR